MTKMLSRATVQKCPEVWLTEALLLAHLCIWDAGSRVLLTLHIRGLAERQDLGSHLVPWLQGLPCCSGRAPSAPAQKAPERLRRKVMMKGETWNCTGETWEQCGQTEAQALLEEKSQPISYVLRDKKVFWTSWGLFSGEFIDVMLPLGERQILLC